MQPYISIVIPCYEMNGFGVSMLSMCLRSIKMQTFGDYEIIISDDSKNNEILDYVDKQTDSLNINYVHNPNPPGSSSNVNNGIEHAVGRIIKILCQDDLLLSPDSLQRTADSFSLAKGWLVSAYWHTYDRQKLFKLHVPSISNNVVFENLIGTHSCLTIGNQEPVFKFDPELLWFMDSDLYYRYLLHYGMPEIITEPTVVQTIWAGQVTNSLINQEIIQKETAYLSEKYKGNFNGRN